MEQLQPIIQFVSKNRFWIITSIITLAMIGVWFLAAGKLDQAAADGKRSIERQNQAGRTIEGTKPTGIEDVTAHPNNSTLEGMKEEVGKGVDTAIAAWQIRRKAQEDVLIWPARFRDHVDFYRTFSQFDPPERFPKEETGASFHSLLRIYKNGIPSRMTELAQIIQTDWKFANLERQADITTAGGSSTGTGTGTGAATGNSSGNASDDEFNDPRGGNRDGSRQFSTGNTEAEDPIVVYWKEDNQDLWNEKLTQFAGRDDNRLQASDNLPSPLQVYMLQQDLWLLEAIFNVIARVNDGATSNDFALIKKIDHVVFGREVDSQLGTLRPITEAINEAALGDGGTLGGRGGRGGLTGGALAGGQRGGGIRGAGTVDPADNPPFDNRYIDAEKNPLSAEDVRAVMALGASTEKAEQLPTENLELVVARRVPVRIAVVMDERKIANFIEAAGESPFAFEIEQVRVNRHPLDEPPKLADSTQTASGDDSANDPERTIGQSGGSSGLVDDPSNGGTSALEESAALAPAHVRTSFDVAVEFYGFVKLYNPVQEWLLRGEARPVEEAIPETITAQPGDESSNTDPVDGDGTTVAPEDAGPAPVQPGVANPGVANPGVADPGVADPDAAGPAQPEPAPPAGPAQPAAPAGG